jgi:hypothetical protein
MCVRRICFILQLVFYFIAVILKHAKKYMINVLFQTSCNDDKTVPFVSYTKIVYDAKYLNEVTHHAEKC